MAAAVWMKFPAMEGLAGDEGWHESIRGSLATGLMQELGPEAGGRGLLAV